MRALSLAAWSALAVAAFSAGLIAGLPPQDRRVGELFDGKRLEKADLGLVPKEFTIDVKFRSEPVSAPVTYGETSPRMPLILSGLGVEQHDDSYRVVLGSNAVKVGDPDVDQRLTIVVSGGGAAKIFVDGRLAATTAYEPSFETTLLAVGKGYKNRSWRGEISWLEVYDKPLFDAEFAADEHILVQDARALYTLGTRSGS